MVVPRLVGQNVRYPRWSILANGKPLFSMSLAACVERKEIMYE